jgi:branched-chain amino acid transport system substrate-binding protein
MLSDCSEEIMNTKRMLIKTASAASVALFLNFNSCYAYAAEYVINITNSLTGAIAFIGVPETNAARLAVDDLNAIKYLGSDSLKTNVYDDGSDRAQAVSLVNRSVISDNAVAILGADASFLGSAVAPIVNELKIPFVGTGPSADPYKSGPWYFKITVDALGAVTSIAKYTVEKLQPKRPAVIVARDNEGLISQTKAFKEYLTSHGAPLIAEESVVSSETDFSALATKLVVADPDAIWLGVNASQAANIAIQLRHAGLPNTAALVGATSLAGDYLKIGGGAVEETYISAEYNLESADALNQAFVTNYTKRYGVAPDGNAANGYSAILIIAQAIKNSMPAPTRERVREALTQLKDVKVLLGNGRWNIGSDRLPISELQILVAKGGKFVEVH